MKNESKHNFDIVVVGGGPAGTAAALTLLKYSTLKVAVIENTDYHNIRVGETVSPAIKSLLRYLGVEKDFLNGGHVPSYGTHASWGSSRLISKDFLFTGLGNGWHLDRRGFDLMMANKVKERNGLLLTSSRVIVQNQDEQKNWQLTVMKNNNKKIEINTSFVIDASGKKAVFARKLGSKWKILDQLIGVINFYQLGTNQNNKHFALIESFPDGWWYSAQLPNNIRVVAFMTDSDICENMHIQKLENWNTLLKKTSYIKKTLGKGQSISLPKIYPAHSQVIQQIEYAKWAPTGDTASSFDPLSSMGIGYAIESGIHAARSAHDQLTSNGDLLSQYLVNIAQNFSQYVKRRSQYYMREQRWAERLFWRRRQDQLKK